MPGVLKDRGKAERELRKLAQEGKITYLQLPTSSSDVAVLDGDEYRALLSEKAAFADFALRNAAKLYCTREELDKAGCLKVRMKGRSGRLWTTCGAWASSGRGAAAAARTPTGSPCRRAATSRATSWPAARLS